MRWIFFHILFYFKFIAAAADIATIYCYWCCYFCCGCCCHYYIYLSVYPDTQWLQNTKPFLYHLIIRSFVQWSILFIHRTFEILSNTNINFIMWDFFHELIETFVWFSAGCACVCVVRDTRVCAHSHVCLCFARTRARVHLETCIYRYTQRNIARARVVAMR